MMRTSANENIDCAQTRFRATGTFETCLSGMRVGKEPIESFAIAYYVFDVQIANVDVIWKL